MKKSLFVDNSERKSNNQSYYGSVPSYYSKRNNQESTPVNKTEKLDFFKKSPKSKSITILT